MSSRLKSFYPVWICLLLMLGLSYSVTYDEAAPLAQEASNHPSLFFTASEIPAMREAAETTHEPIWRPINRYASELLSTSMPSSPPANADYNFFRSEGSRLVSIAFACVITDRSDFCQLAKNRMLAHASWPVWDENDQNGLGLAHMMFGNALAYDWLYNKLSNSEKSLVRNSLLEQGNALYFAGVSSTPNPQTVTWWYKSYFQNHYYIMNSSLGIAALALSNDVLGLNCENEETCVSAEASATVQEWLSAVADRLRIGQMILNNIGDGSWHEGIPYQNYFMTFLIAFTSNYRDLTGFDLIPHTYFQNYVNWRVYNSLDNGEFILPFGDFDWDWANGYSPQAILRFVASEYNNPTAEWLAQEIVSETGRPEFENPWHVFEFLYYDPDISAEVPASVPLSYLSTDTEAAIWRTGWESDDLVFGFKSGAYAGRYGFDSFVNGTNPPWEVPCESHGCQLNIGHDHQDVNSFTLYRNGEWLVPENVFWGGYDTDLHNTILIDGQGQYRPPVNRYEQYPEDFVGSDAVLQTGGNAHFFNYLVSDATGRYKNISGIQDVSRRVLFLRPDYFLILDQLAADSAHEYEAVIHFPNDINQQDRWLTGTTPDGQILGVNIVAPQDFDVHIDNSGEYPAAHIEPSANSSNARLLYAVVPSENASWNQRPTTTLLHDEAAYSLIQVQTSGASLRTRNILVSYADQPTLINNTLLSTDGLLAMVGSDSSGAVLQVGLHRGSFVRDVPSGRFLLANVPTGGTYDLEHVGTTVSIHTSQASADGAVVFAPAAANVSVNDNSHPFLRCDQYIVVGATVPQVNFVNLTNCTLVTPTPGENLLSNGSFEAVDSGGSPHLRAWTLKDAQRDKVVCNKTPTIASKGNCAFRFNSKGIVSGAKLTQVVDLSGRDIQVGDSLRMDFSYNFAKPGSKLKVKCIVSYANDQQPSGKLKQSIGQTTGYQTFSGDVFVSNSGASKVKIVLIHKSQDAKGYIDAARLEVIRAGIPQLLPLP
jgi:hypothetical protein